MAEPEPEAEVQPSNDGPLYIVKKWKVVGTWSWNFESDTCAICRNSLYEPSLDVQAKGFDDVAEDDAGMMFARGECGHVFHLDCITRWLSSRNVCPMCNKEWETRSTGKIGGATADD